jgi:hypothetical protein
MRCVPPQSNIKCPTPFGHALDLMKAQGVTLLVRLHHLLLWDAPRRVALRVDWHASGEVSLRARHGAARESLGIIDRMQDGKIKDAPLIMDSLGLMRRLGVFPSAKA